jgi:hypothetical protein
MYKENNMEKNMDIDEMAMRKFLHSPLLYDKGIRKYINSLFHKGEEYAH